MESYTSDSSDSDNATKTLDFSYRFLDSKIINDCLDTTKESQNVETLILRQNRLNYVPENIKKFINLHVLDLSNCELEQLPDFLSDCPLTTLVAKNNILSNDSLPKSFEAFATLRELNLSGNRLTDFPEQVFDITGLRYLHLSGNGISKIAKDIWKLQRLQILSMGGNRLTDVPSTLGQLTTLQGLILCDNMLESLPASIANLKNLKTLQLHKNKLKTLPTEIITLSCLSELSLRDNPLVIRFVSDMTLDPPSLLELAARVIKLNNIYYEKNDLPQNLNDYLNSGHYCVNPKCKSVFFNNRVEHVKFVDFCGTYRLPLLQYLCSSKCIEPKENKNEINRNGIMMRKVLLG